MSTHKAKSKRQTEAQRAEISRQNSENGKKGGRPPGSGMLEGLPVWFTNMKQMSSAIGVSEQVLRDAKKAGWPCFRVSRIHLQDFLKRFFTEQSQLQLRLGDGTDVKMAAPIAGKTMKEHYDGLRAKADYEKTVLNVLVSRSEVRDGLATAQSELFATLDQKFLSELPPALAGKDAKQIRERVAPELAEVKAGWRTRMREIEEAGTQAVPKEDRESESAGSEE
jgi:hypothetical protein